MKKSFLFLLYIVALAVVFLPKEKLFYTAESYLSDYGIYLSDTKLHNRLFYLDAEGSKLLLDHNHVGNIDNIRIVVWFFYNSINIKNLSLSDEYRIFFPGTIEEMSMTYSLMHPFSVMLDAKGDFGTCQGSYDITEGKVRLVFDQTSQLKRYPLLLSKLHTQNGGLVYESDIK